jgi:hypothetical protein
MSQELQASYNFTKEQIKELEKLRADLAEREAEIAKLREALATVVRHDEYVMFQRCPDCDYKCSGTCKDMPHSDYGKIAMKALSTPQPSSYLEQWEKEKYGEPRSYLYKYHNCFGEVVWSNLVNQSGQTPLETVPLYARKD